MLKKIVKQTQIIRSITYNSCQPKIEPGDIVVENLPPLFSIEDYLTDEDWKKRLKTEFKKPYFKEINRFLNVEYSTKKIMPPKELVFNAFNQTDFKKIKVVIIGQDPYHDNGQAHGLAFSVPKGVPPPPSLKNIFTELRSDIKTFKQSDGCLLKWSQQGVFLLNSFLTVEAHKPCSHSSIGWEKFTDRVIEMISTRKTGCVFLLWGNFAQSKAPLIDSYKHKIIRSAHPSPFSAHRFFGSRCFSKTNRFLVSNGKTPISWSLD